MNRFRGILIRWSKKAENYIALLHLLSPSSFTGIGVIRIGSKYTNDLGTTISNLITQLFAWLRMSAVRAGRCLG